MILEKLSERRQERRETTEERRRSEAIKAQAAAYAEVISDTPFPAIYEVGKPRPTNVWEFKIDVPPENSILGYAQELEAETQALLPSRREETIALDLQRIALLNTATIGIGRDKLDAILEQDATAWIVFRSVNTDSI